MKRLTLMAGIAVGFLLLPGFILIKYTERKWSAIFNQLEISEDLAKESVRNSFIFDRLEVPFSTKYKALQPSGRKQAVQEIGDFIKSYMNSENFANEYRTERSFMKPIFPDHEAELETKIEEVRNNIQETKESLQSATGDIKSILQESLSMLEDELSILQNPEHPDYAMYTGMIPEVMEMEKAEFKLKMDEFESNYPEDIQVFIKGRLKQFLEFTKDIDFNAKLIEQGGKMKFANPTYESKDHDWKLCFRAGKETIDAAREYAINWIQELK